MTSSDGSWSQQYALYLPRTLLAWQAQDDPPAVFETDGTFLLVDISGFTAMSEMLAEQGKVGSEQVTAVLNEAFTELLDIVMLDGGDLLRFGGDALFNLYTGDGHAARACRSALDMRQALEEFQETKSPAPLKMSVGVASGPITAILAGDQSHELLFVGPTASEVVALQSAADPDEILISPQTLEMLGDDSVVAGEKAGGHLLVAEPDVDDFDEEDDAAVDVSGIDLGSFIPTRLRDHLSLSFNEGEHRPATIAFVKFTGTDEAFADKGAAATGEMLGRLVSITQAAAERYGVCFLAADVDDDGGKLILSTGVPERSPGQNERIINALRDIAEADPPFPVQAGVARGHVFAGDLGARFRRVYTVMGDTVNLAARLASTAGPGEVLVTARALDRSADAFETTELDPITLKGKTKPVAPLRIGARAAEPDKARDVPAQELIGRDDQVAEIAELAAEATAGRGSAVEVVGRPGMGKSRVVHAALETLPTAVRWLHVNCERYEAATPYHAAGQLVRAALDLKDADPETAGADLAARVEEVAPDQVQWLPLLADVVGATVAPTPAVDSLAVDFRQSTLHEATASVLAAAVPSSAVITIEDSHWADESSRLLFAALAGSISDHPWFLVALRSSDEGEPLAGELPEIEIGPLDESAAVELVTKVAGEDTPLPFAEEIARRAGGNPFYVIELAKVAQSFDAGDLPESIEAVTLARIDRLRQGDRRLLRYASVFGETFALDLLADAMPDIASNVDDPAVWSRLGEFLDTTSLGKVRFKQMIVRDVAYAGLPFKRRAEIHLAIAQALERRARRRPERFAEAMSLHFDRAESWERSWTYSRLAGDRAVTKMAHVEAMRIYRRGLRAAAHIDAESSGIERIREAVGDAAEHLGMSVEAEAAYDECLAARPPPVAESRLLRKKGMLYVARGDIDDARRLLDESLARIQSEAPGNDPVVVETELETMIAMAGLHFREGDYTATVEWCTKAVDLAGEEHLAELAHALYMRSVAYTHLSGMDGSVDGHKALEVYEELKDLVGQTNVLNNMGYDAYYRGAWDEAVELWSRSIETGTKSGDIVRTASSIHNLGEIFLDQGHYDDVEERLSKALRIWQGAGFAIGVGLSRANLARLFTRTGQLERAEEELDRARVEFTQAGAEAYVLEEIIRRCEWLVYAKRPREAVELATQTLGGLEGKDGTDVSQSSLHRMAAYALAASDRHDEACEHIDASLELARTADSDYEIAQTLEAALRIEGADPDRAAHEGELEAKLGIVARPWIPIYHSWPSPS